MSYLPVASRTQLSTRERATIDMFSLSCMKMSLEINIKYNNAQYVHKTEVQLNV